MQFRKFTCLSHKTHFPLPIPIRLTCHGSIEKEAEADRDRVLTFLSAVFMWCAGLAWLGWLLLNWNLFCSVINILAVRHCTAPLTPETREHGVNSLQLS